MVLAKLDNYDYMVLPGEIRVRLQSNSDPSLVDIMSEIQITGGKIYVEGNYYDYLGYDMLLDGADHFLVLKVVQIA